MVVIVYILSLCSANLLVAYFGAWITPINAFFLVGLEMILRDILHERYGILRSIILSMVAGGVSYLINPDAGIIAFASLVAFVSSAIVNAWVYQLLIKKSWFKKSNISNIAAAGVDSILFPLIAFGAFMPVIIIAQFVCKIGGGALWSFILKSYKNVK